VRPPVGHHWRPPVAGQGFGDSRGRQLVSCGRRRAYGPPLFATASPQNLSEPAHSLDGLRDAPSFLSRQGVRPPSQFARVSHQPPVAGGYPRLPVIWRRSRAAHRLIPDAADIHVLEATKPPTPRFSVLFQQDAGGRHRDRSALIWINAASCHLRNADLPRSYARWLRPALSGWPQWGPAVNLAAPVGYSGETVAMAPELTPKVLGKQLGTTPQTCRQGPSAELKRRLGEKQPGRRHQRSSSSIDTRSLKHEIASVWSYRHRCHDRDAGNGANDDPHFQYHEHAGSRRRDERTDFIS
jgi:hypothetical protein